jgi:hypothetical protein
MASVRTVDGAIDLDHRSLPGRGLLTRLATYWNALREGSAAAHDYERLVCHGVAHEEAVVRIFEDHFGRR